jgi:hypothetical protein
MINHVISCIWYAIGKHAASMEGEAGWVHDFELDHPVTTWNENKAIAYLYFTSLHWAITQFQGTSDILPGYSLSERVTAVLVVISAFIIFSWFVSSLTNMMMRLQQLESDRNTEQSVVRGYLSNHHISTALAVRVKKYVEWNQRMQTYREHDAKVVQLMPKEIMADLLEEVRVPVVCGHRFFAIFRLAYPRIVKRMCAEVLEKTPAPDEEIFSPHDDDPRMYIVETGVLEYSVSSSDKKTQGLFSSPSDLHRSRSKGQIGWQSSGDSGEMLSKGSWLAEQALWTNWSHVGRLVGKSDSCLLVVECRIFTGIVKSNSAAHCSAVYYARRFVGELNRFGKTYTDHLPGAFFDGLMSASADEEEEE